MPAPSCAHAENSKGTLGDQGAVCGNHREAMFGNLAGAAFIPLRSVAMLDSYLYAYREPWPNCGAFEDFLGGSWQDEHVAGAGRMKSSDRQLASRSIIFWAY